MIYLDTMATTPIASEVLEAMMPMLADPAYFANPSATQYPLGQRAAEQVAKARQQLANAIQSQDPNKLIFTSGATEANNLALQGVAHAHAHKGKHIIANSAEHSAVLDVLSALQKQGFSVTYVKPDSNGIIQLNHIQAAIQDDTILATLMWVNNEIGVIQDVVGFADLCRQHQIISHVDAAQALGKVPVNVNDVDVDCLSFSAHKFYGPKGAGALYLRSPSRLRLQPLMYGGGQEQHIRPGTLATHQIVGLATAAELAVKNLEDNNKKIEEIQQATWQQLETLPNVMINGSTSQRVVHNVNFSLPGINGAACARWLGEHNICVATGSACHSADHQPSHVLRALGRTVEEASAAIRLSFSPNTTVKEIEKTVEMIHQFIKETL